MIHGPVTSLDGTSHGTLSPDASILLVTGIARPGPYRRYLEERAGHVVHLPFPDHHRFTARDLRRVVAAFLALPGEPRYLFTTEKDAARLSSTSLPPAIAGRAFYIPVEPRFLDTGESFTEIITTHVRQDSRK
jgi:tetraacyldisaccharide 4'-kinase